MYDLVWQVKVGRVGCGASSLYIRARERMRAADAWSGQGSKEAGAYLSEANESSPIVGKSPLRDLCVGLHDLCVRVRSLVGEEKEQVGRS